MNNSIKIKQIKGWDRNIIASKIAKHLPHGSYVNLGIGMPELVSQYLSLIHI